METESQEPSITMSLLLRTVFQVTVQWFVYGKKASANNREPSLLHVVEFKRW